MLLVAVLTTKARITRQWSHAQRKLQGVAAADRLLAAWWPQRDAFPRRSSGPVPSDASLRWRTTPLLNQPLNALRTSVVRLDILDERATRPGEDVLASVDVVLDDELPRSALAAGGAP
jgi:hypothetical protein